MRAFCCALIPINLAGDDHGSRDNSEEKQRTEKERVVFRDKQAVDAGVKGCEPGSEGKTVDSASQNRDQIQGKEADAGGAGEEVSESEGDVLAEANEEEEKGRQTEAHEKVLHRVNEHPLHELEKEEAAEGEQDEEDAVFHGAVREAIRIDEIRETDADCVDIL